MISAVHPRGRCEAPECGQGAQRGLQINHGAAHIGGTAVWRGAHGKVAPPPGARIVNHG